MAWYQTEARSVSDWSSLTATHNYRQETDAHRCTWTTDSSTRSAHMMEDQRALTCFAGDQHLGWGGYCHDPFPELSPTHCLCPVLPRLTPFQPFHALHTTLILPDHAL